MGFVQFFVKVFFISFLFSCQQKILDECPVDSKQFCLCVFCWVLLPALVSQQVSGAALPNIKSFRFCCNGNTRKFRRRFLIHKTTKCWNLNSTSCPEMFNVWMMCLRWNMVELQSFKEGWVFYTFWPNPIHLYRGFFIIVFLDFHKHRLTDLYQKS